MKKLIEAFSLMSLGFAIMLIPFFVPALAITSMGGLIVGFIGMIVLVVAICCIKDETIGNTLFGAFAILTGMVIYPAVMLTGIPMATVALAVGLTVVMFIGLVMYALYSGRDFSGMGGFLFTALLILIAASILNIFLGLGWLQTMIAYVGVVIFSGFILYDTQDIVRGNGATTAQNALSMFLNIVNLFLHLLDALD